MNELYSNGLHHGAARIEKGDSNLKPEKAYSLGISANYNSKKMVLDINTYYKKIYDFIFLQPTFPPQLTIRGAFPLFVFKQTNAQLYGADISATYHFTHHLNTEAKMSILYAFNSSASEWLINMPSNKFDLACNYTFNDAKVMKNNYVKVNTKYVAQQTRIPTTGNIEIQQPDSTISIQSDYLAPPNGYFIVGAEFGTQAEWHHKNILLTITASNLLNTQYREYLNAFRYFSDEMGRNISLKIKIPF
jgi:iron complex outermembrane receptor protein